MFEPFAAGRGLTPWLRLLLVLLVLPAAARAANDDERFAQLVRLASDDRGVRQEVLQQLGRSRDGRLVAFFAAYQQGDAYVHNGRVVLCPKFQEIEGRKMAPLSDPLSARVRPRRTFPLPREKKDRGGCLAPFLGGSPDAAKKSGPS